MLDRDNPIVWPPNLGARAGLVAACGHRVSGRSWALSWWVRSRGRHGWPWAVTDNSPGTGDRPRYRPLSREEDIASIAKHNLAPGILARHQRGADGRCTATMCFSR